MDRKQGLPALTEAPQLNHFAGFPAGVNYGLHKLMFASSTRPVRSSRVSEAFRRQAGTKLSYLCVSSADGQCSVGQSSPKPPRKDARVVRLC